jgi:hypothetical protein
MVLGAALYAVLTFKLQLDPKPDYSLVTVTDAARTGDEQEVPTADAAGRPAAAAGEH